MTPIPPTHDVPLLVLSYVVSVLGAWTALMLSRQIVLGSPEDRTFWIGSAAFAMGGGGIWSMHFIAMLAYGLPIPVGYDPTLTLVSLLVAVAATALGFTVAHADDPRSAVLAGVPMGLGIAAMHFIGMAAMRLPARAEYDARWVALAVAFGIVASSASLTFAFRSLRPRIRVAGAMGLAAGVSGMHHSAMAALSLYPDPESSILIPTGLSGATLGYGVFLVTVLVLAIALGVTRPLRVDESMPATGVD